MPRAAACPVSLTAAERDRLKKIERTPTAPFRLVIRAKIVRLAAGGATNAAIGRRLRIDPDTAAKWRGRFAVKGMDGLGDLPRNGRPRRFTPVQVAEVKALACQLPAQTGAPLSLWSCPELAREAVDRGITESISASTIRRWLAADALKPWQHRSWIFIRDPDFADKAGRVLDLYQRRWQGRALGPTDFVISADEKTSIQARCRCHPSLPPGKARAMRVEHEYDRGGALAYIAALDVGTGTITGQCADTTGIDPFMRLVTHVMRAEPYASADRVFWIVDNGSSHRGQRAINRLTTAFPNAIMVHTPVHASWLNQIEIYFSIVQRKVVNPNDFTDPEQIRQRLRDFEHRYNTTAKPFAWNFDRTDLDQMLTRIDQHDYADQPARAA